MDVKSEEHVTRWRKKPVVIEAAQLTRQVAYDCLRTGQPFAFGRRLSGDWHEGRGIVYNAWVTIDTLEGRMRCEIGDWLIKGIKGELYPCKNDIFEATYEPA